MRAAAVPVSRESLPSTALLATYAASGVYTDCYRTALPREVAYLPQTEALCGGAASAMVMRYWGDTSIRPEDFAPLVDARQNGIVTTVLVDNLRGRGWQPYPLRGGQGVVCRPRRSGHGTAENAGAQRICSRVFSVS